MNDAGRVKCPNCNVIGPLFLRDTPDAVNHEDPDTWCDRFVFCCGWCHAVLPNQGRLAKLFAADFHWETV